MMTSEQYLAFHRRRHAMLLGILNRHVPKHITRSLDIGGAGDLLNLSSYGNKTFGAEAHTEDLGDSVAEGIQKGLVSQACNIDESPLPYPDGHFDLVIFASVVEHLYNPFFALDEMHRVLASGGLLLLEAPNAVALGRRVDILKGRNPFRWFNEYNAHQQKSHMIFCSVFYSPEEAEALVRQHGFEVLERDYGLHTPPLSLPKKAIRETIVRLFPRSSDCYAIMARKR